MVNTMTNSPMVIIMSWLSTVPTLSSRNVCIAGALSRSSSSTLNSSPVILVANSSICSKLMVSSAVS